MSQTNTSPISGNTGTSRGAFCFTRKEHLKKRDEIAQVFKKGRLVSCPGAKLFILNNKLNYNKITVTFSRKFGNAVARNRARRLGREAYRLSRKQLKQGFDLVFLFYPGIDSLAQRQEQLDVLFSKANFFKADRVEKNDA
ncbi:ribonuclease P protein component [Breznakiellaceae bacterium SP9]